MPTKSNVRFELTPDQALVLFELLARFLPGEALMIAHDSEVRVLAILEAKLEKTLLEPFEPNYSERIRDAGETVAATPIEDEERH